MALDPFIVIILIIFVKKEDQLMCCVSALDRLHSLLPEIATLLFCRLKLPACT